AVTRPRHFLHPLTLLLVASLLGTTTIGAQQLTRADSTLVTRILMAEDRRDTTDAALAEGRAHPDVRVRMLAERAVARTRDARFVDRTSFPVLAQAPLWVEPAWRVRFRQLPALRDDCPALRLAAADSAWPVRLRAADLARATCASDTALVATFLRWIDRRPSKLDRRRRGEVSWQGAAHAIVAVARLAPDEARPRLEALATDRSWPLRRAAARAAGVVNDTLLLRRLATDRDDNVAETAIELLRERTAHADDAIYLSALSRKGAPVVRAAAIALKGSSAPALADAAIRAYHRFAARNNASERDVRVALLEAAGRPATEDRIQEPPRPLPRDAVRLALGDTITLRVTMATRSGGGTFHVRLRGDVAPIMAARLAALAERGYYDGLSWHRVEHDFVIQGGSQGANEYVGHPLPLRDELGTLSHRRGTLGMSTRGHDTGDAQWFVNLRDNARLDRDYTVWGEVIAGIDVIDAILEGDVIRSIRPRPAPRGD
ncbi:MAG: peptidylprolyl isomerase, partial [Gemmatimonadota bacterium]